MLLSGPVALEGPAGSADGRSAGPRGSDAASTSAPRGGEAGAHLALRSGQPRRPHPEQEGALPGLGAGLGFRSRLREPGARLGLTEKADCPLPQACLGVLTEFNRDTEDSCYRKGLWGNK